MYTIIRLFWMVLAKIYPRPLHSQTCPSPPPVPICPKLLPVSVCPSPPLHSDSSSHNDVSFHTEASTPERSLKNAKKLK